jgi:hypothetical protein
MALDHTPQVATAGLGATRAIPEPDDGYAGGDIHTERFLTEPILVVASLVNFHSKRIVLTKYLPYVFEIAGDPEFEFRFHLRIERDQKYQHLHEVKSTHLFESFIPC